MRGLSVKRSIQAFLVCMTSFVMSGTAESGKALSPHLEMVVVDREIFLGTPFVVELVARYPGSWDLHWPDRFDFGTQVEEYTRRRDRSIDGDVVSDRLVLRLLALDIGRQRLPALGVTIRAPNAPDIVIRSAAQEFEVVSVLGPDDMKIRALTGPVPVLARQWFWPWKLGVGVLLLFGLIVWILRKNEGANQEPEISAPLLSPHAEAYLQFDKLEESGRLQQSPPSLGYIEMSEILRRYIARRFDIPALDMTSAEIRSRLSSVDNSRDWLRALEQWLGACDVVKFAKQSVSHEETLSCLHSARILVDKTKTVERESPREIARA